MKNRPRLVHITRSLGLGGVESQLLNLLPHLKEEFDVSVVCLHEKGRLAEKLEGAGIPVSVFRFRSRWSPVGLWRLARYLRRERVSIVQTHMYGANVSGIVAARLGGVPVRISTVHNMDQWRGSRRVLTDRMVLPWRHAVFCVSEPVRRVYMEKTGCPADRCRVFPNAIDMESFIPRRSQKEVRAELKIPEDSPIVGTVARLVPEKNLNLFLDTADRIHRERSDVRFLLVGEGSLRKELENRTASLGLSGVVVFTGLRQDVPDLVSIMSCFLLTSKAEGLPVAVLESMAVGVPVVATRVGGVPDIIRSQDEGLLVDSGSARDLAREVLRILSQPELADSLRNQGRKRARDFSVEVVAADLSRLYQELLMQCAAS